MAKQTALIKCSGSLLGNWEAFHFMHGKQAQYALRVVCGGGEQINNLFRERGWPIHFGPMGRICEDFEQRLAAENILKFNAAELEDRLDDAQVNASVITPVFDKEVGGVTCHVNGDLLPLICYNGFDKIFVLTKQSEVKRKRRFYAALWTIFSKHLDARDVPDALEINFDFFPPKIEIIGITDLDDEDPLHDPLSYPHERMR